MGGLSDPSDRRSPVEAMRSVGVSVLRSRVKEREPIEALSLLRWFVAAMGLFKQTEFIESSMLNK